MSKTKQLTAALYARYSDDSQSKASIDDQFDTCMRVAKLNGWKVTHKFSDPAKSGDSLFNRPGSADLMAAVKAKKFDVVICETLSRLSRSEADTHALFKRLRHAGIIVHTMTGLADGMRVTFEGLMNAEFLKNLKIMTKRGLDGRARLGKFPGALTYGYDLVQNKPGERTINVAQAKVIQRIFTEYASGISPRDIAASLTRDGIPTPRGGTDWNHQTFVGNKIRGGLIGNRLYIGQIIWNKAHVVTDPDTNAKSKVASPESEHITSSVPHLRIIDQKLWDAAHRVRTGRSLKKFGPGGVVRKGQPVMRGRHLLSGLLRCGVCDNQMVVSNTSKGLSFIKCSAALASTACTHSKGYQLGKLTEKVFDGIVNNLSAPEALAARVKAFHEEFLVEAKKNNREKIEAEKQHAKLSVQIDRLVNAIEETGPLPVLLSSITAKDAERSKLAEHIKMLSATNVTAIHPKAVERYQMNVKEFHRAVSSDPNNVENRTIARSMIERIVVQPTARGQEYDFAVYGRLAAILGVDLFPTMRSNAEILAAEGLSDTSLTATEASLCCLYRTSKASVVSMVRRKAA